MTKRRFQILVCDGPSCGVTHESDRLLDCLRAGIDRDPSLANRVALASYTCFGRCDDGPNLFVQELEPGEEADPDPDPDVFDQQRGFYPGMNEDRVQRVLDRHCRQGEIDDELIDDY